MISPWELSHAGRKAFVISDRPLLNQLNERMADLRTRAQEATTSASRAELLRLAERLAERKAQIIQ